MLPLQCPEAVAVAGAQWSAEGRLTEHAKLILQCSVVVGMHPDQATGVCRSLTRPKHRGSICPEAHPQPCVLGDL